MNGAWRQLKWRRPARLPGGSDDRRRHQELPGVPLRVLGRVDEQPQDRRRHAVAPDGPRLQERARVGRADLVERAVHGVLERRRQPARGEGGAGLALGPERGELGVRERLAAGVRQQPVEDAGEVLEVEPDRGPPRRPRPQSGVGHVAGDLRDVLSGLDERVRDGLEQVGDAGERPSQPGFEAVGAGRHRPGTPPRPAGIPGRDSLPSRPRLPPSERPSRRRRKRGEPTGRGGP